MKPTASIAGEGDFRREYGRLNEVRQKLGSPPVLAFTATAGKEMQDRILASLGIPEAQVFVRDVDRPNIAMLRWQCQPDKRAGEIAAMLRLRQLLRQKVMVFVPSTKVGDMLRQELGELGLDVPFYHSKLGTAWERTELLQRFLGESRPVVDHIICSNAFGMGLDVPNVRLVIHWQQSASVEDMLQEFGRAGRDRNPSVSVIFHDGHKRRDAGRLKFMAERTVDATPLDNQARDSMLELRHHEIDQVTEILRLQGCFRKAVRAYFGQAEVRPRRTFSELLLDWAFGSRAPKIKHLACCDSCDARWIRRHGALRYVGSNVGHVK